MNPTTSLIDAIEKKMSSLMEAYDALINENLSLENQISQLKEEKSYLDKRNEQLVEEKTGLMNKIDLMIEANKHKELEISGLKKLKLNDLSETEQQNLNALIGDYLVEIDKCIALLES